MSPINTMCNNVSNTVQEERSYDRLPWRSVWLDKEMTDY